MHPQSPPAARVDQSSARSELESEPSSVRATVAFCLGVVSCVHGLLIVPVGLRYVPWLVLTVSAGVLLGTLEVKAIHDGLAPLRGLKMARRGRMLAIIGIVLAVVQIVVLYAVLAAIFT